MANAVRSFGFVQKLAWPQSAVLSSTAKKMASFLTPSGIKELLQPGFQIIIVVFVLQDFINHLLH